MTIKTVTKNDKIVNSGSLPLTTRPKIAKNDLVLSDGSVRLIPALNIAALEQGYDKELLFWYLLRWIDKSGTGRIPLELAYQVLVEKLRYYSYRGFYRVLASGELKLWKQYENGHSRIEIKGLKQVSEWFNTLPDTFVSIDITEIPGSDNLQARRALLWNTGAYKPIGKEVNPISRASLVDKTGIDRRRQQRYDAVIDTDRQETIVKYRDSKNHVYRVKKEPRITTAGLLELPVQLGNKYHSKATLSHRGMTHKIAKAMRIGKGSLLGDEATHKDLIAKRYFKTFSDYVNAKKRGRSTEVGYYPTKKNPEVYVECFITDYCPI